jgi:hypothetical protein
VKYFFGISTCRRGGHIIWDSRAFRDGMTFKFLDTTEADSRRPDVATGTIDSDSDLVPRYRDYVVPTLLPVLLPVNLSTQKSCSLRWSMFNSCSYVGGHMRYISFCRILERLMYISLSSASIVMDSDRRSCGGVTCDY